MSTSQFEVRESVGDGLWFTYRLKTILASEQSEFQKVDLIDTVPFGRALMLDGVMQSSDADEFIYHECLVHPAMLAHPCPKKVYIGGGGEGATAREVLRHKTVEECVMCDIDGVAVEFCKKFLPQNTAAFNDPRLKLVIDDAKAELAKYADGYFDVIIMDLDDPLEGGPCFDLYTEEFYRFCSSKLSPEGVFVTQCASGGRWFHTAVFTPVHLTLKRVFPVVAGYNQAILSFGDEWSWNVAWKNQTGAGPLAPAEVDARIAARINGELRFLDGESYVGIFSLGKHVRESLKKETRILSRENPALFLAGTAKGTTTQER